MVQPPPPVLEMLWEDADPAQVLAQRFGLPDARAAADWVGHVLEQHWGITAGGCSRVVMSDRNALAHVASTQGGLVVKWCVDPGRFPRLEALARLTVWLDEQGLPVSRPVAGRHGSAQQVVDHRSVGVQRLVAGQLLDTDDPREVREAGRVLARFHRALRRHPARCSPAPDAPGQDDVHARLAAWLAAPPHHLPAEALDGLAAMLGRLPRDPLPAQLGHGDFRSANLLCQDHRVVAALDLEEARVEPRVVELARSAVLLGTRYHAWGPVPLAVHQQLLDGYQAGWPLEAEELAWWPALRLWTTLLFVPAGDDPTGWGESARQLARSTMSR